MDKREIKGEKWEEEVMVEEVEIIMFNSNIIHSPATQENGVILLHWLILHL